MTLSLYLFSIYAPVLQGICSAVKGLMHARFRQNLNEQITNSSIS